MDSPVTFNFLNLQEGFIERKCDGGGCTGEKKTLFHTNVYYIWIAPLVHFRPMSTKYLWWTNSACESTGKEKVPFSLSLCQLLGKCCCKKPVILKGNRSSSTSQVVEGKSTPLQCKQTNSAEQSRVTANTVKWWRPNRKPKEVKLNNIMTHWMLTTKKSFQMSVFWPKTDKCPPHT